SISFGSSYDSQILIETNINKELGFLCAYVYTDTIRYAHYSIDENGTLLNLTKYEIPEWPFGLITLFTSLATVDEGYVILYAEYSVNEADIMSSLGG
ncbi:29663_t:CDS:2, partial [Racocetra persica]